MEKVLLVCATVTEAQPLLNRMGAPYFDSGNLKSYTFLGLQLDFLVTGVGMISSAYYLTKALQETKYDLVINAGICGSFSPKLPIGTVVQVTADSFPEIGAESQEGFISFESLSTQQDGITASSHGVLVNSYQPSYLSLISLPVVTGATVNTVHGKALSIKEFLSRVTAEIESMEGAAVLYICLRENIPCIQLRAVSNFVEPRNRSNWNIPLAIDQLNACLHTLVTEIAGK